MSEVIKAIGEQINRIFRHLLPSVIIVGAARIAHPGWFPSFEDSKAWHFAILAIVTFAVGNVWYVTHRYTLHQLIDYRVWSMNGSSPTWAGYQKWLSGHIGNSAKRATTNPKLDEHIVLRSAHVILLFIVSEVVFVFAVLDPDPTTVFYRHRCAFVLLSVVFFAAAIFQYHLVFKLDEDTAKELGNSNPVTSAAEVLKEQGATTENAP